MSKETVFGVVFWGVLVTTYVLCRVIVIARSKGHRRRSREVLIPTLTLFIILTMLAALAYSADPLYLDDPDTRLRWLITQERRERARVIPKLILEGYNIEVRHGYITVAGEVTSNSRKNLQHVDVVVRCYTLRGRFVKTGSNLVKYDPVLPGQTTPFRVIIEDNPAIQRVRIDFKHFLGGAIPTVHRPRRKGARAR